MQVERFRRVLPALIFILALSLFLACVKFFRAPRLFEPQELSVALPIPVQVLLAGGDRYLAANIGGFRSVFAGVHRLPPESYAALAKVQRDVSVLNPWHEDNYYLAAAILPWNDQLAAAQYILMRAVEVRTADDMPPFFWAFNQMHFLGDSVAAARMLEKASERSARNKDMLLNLASVWYAKGPDSALAISVTKQMAARTNNPGLKNHLMQRAQRLESRALLQKHVDDFLAARGRIPTGLDELVALGIISKIPDDPWGRGYALRETGAVEAK